ncbi:MAG: hypothetical protein E7294_13985 [Lachnospiraceae bacterium]|nr:hypothetical protein [Lachnospiraceae bacterium]
MRKIVKITEVILLILSISIVFFSILQVLPLYNIILALIIFVVDCSIWAIDIGSKQQELTEEEKNELEQIYERGQHQREVMVEVGLVICVILIIYYKWKGLL